MCFGSKDQVGDDEGARKNAEIDKMLREDKKRVQREIKILLLGLSPSCFLHTSGVAYTAVQAPARAANPQSSSR